MQFNMIVKIWSIGKTNEKYLQEGINIYLKRLTHYTKLEYEELKDVKTGATHEETTKKEAELILSRLKINDILVLLDETGHQYSSVGFANFLEKFQIQSGKNIIFLIGGAYGHHKLIREKAHSSLSFSLMTFSHQMIRLFLVEQIYRAFTILKNEKYHNP